MTYKLSDDELRDYIAKGIPQTQIAALCHVTQQTISNRLKRIERNAAAKASPLAVKAVSSMFNTKEAAEQNYQRCLELLDTCEGTYDRRAVLSEIRAHLEFGIRVVESLYVVQETEAFMREVLDVIGELEPAARETIVRRLGEKRSLRAAFLPHK